MKKTTILIIVGSMLLLLPLASYAVELKKDKTCIDYYKLKQKEAEKIIEKVVPGGTIIGIKDSPVKGVWQIDVQRGEQRGPIYLDYSKKYLIPQLVLVDAIGKQPPARKVDISKIPLADAIVLGAAGAKKKVIVFTDPDCPYCRQLHPIMQQIIAKHGAIAFYIILNPLPMHKDAYKKAQAILCSKSLPLLDDAFSGKAVPEPTCSADAVERTTALAKSLDFNSTPMLVRQDGLVLPGYMPEEKLLEWINAAK